MEKFELVAKTFGGLEEVLAQELIGIGAEKVEIGKRMVMFEGDKRLMYKANLCLRTALRILKPIAKFTATDTDELYDAIRDFDWSQYMDANSTFAVDSVVSGNLFTHSRFVTYRVKDAIVDHFMEKTGKRPSVRLEQGDLQLNVHIADDRVTLSLDSSGEPLCKRGYKVEQTEAPINEVLAAGIILMTGWNGDVDFLDPMCGSGTFLTEAALIAANINPGIYRSNFAFEKWRDFDAELFNELFEDDSEEREVNVSICGGDKDPKAVAIARKNVSNARLDHLVRVEFKPMDEWIENAEEGVMVTNPPYGQRLRPGNMDSLWQMIGKCLKENFKGWHAWIIGMTDEQFEEMHLKPSKKIALQNGALDCSLREFVMFAGKYNDFRAAGGSVGRGDEADRPDFTGIARSKHLGRKEWKEETRRFHHKDSEEGEGRRPYKKDRSGKNRYEHRDSDRRNGEFDGKKRNREFDGKRRDREFDGKRRDREFDGKRREREFDGKKRDRNFEGNRREREFDGKRREFKRNDERPTNKPYRSKPVRSISDKGPSLPENSETRFYEPGMRPRRTRLANKPSENEED